jgi:nucleolar GTP-binding protein
MNPETSLERALKKSRKNTPKKKRTKNTLLNKKKETAATLKQLTKTIKQEIETLQQKIPSFEKTSEYEKEMIQTTTNLETLKKASSHLKKTKKLITTMQVNYTKKIFTSQTEKEIKKQQKEFLGRTNSILKKTIRTTKIIQEYTKKTKRNPKINPEQYTILLAGYPNTGKTTILTRITNSKPKIAHYPFTTKEINLAQLKYKYHEIQIIDTPGLLDRTTQNPIEKKTTATLTHHGNLILFIIDPTLNGGYTLKEQIKLLQKTKQHKKPIIAIINKTDIATQKEIQNTKNELKKENTNYIETQTPDEKLKEKIIENIKEKIKKHSKKNTNNTTP